MSDIDTLNKPAAKPARRLWMAGLGILLLAGLVMGGLLWSQARERRAILTRSLPVRPDLQWFPAELNTRVESCETRVRAGETKALGELSRLYHSNGYYPEACRCYLGLMQLDPSNPAWPHRLASILAGYGQLEESIPLWRLSAELSPDYVQAWVRLGDALLKTGRGAEASQAYAAALSRQPTNPYALLGGARIDIEAGKWQDARIKLEAAARQTNFSVGYDLLATAYEQLGNQERALALRGSMKASGAYFDIPDPRVEEIYFDCYEPYYLDLASGAADRGGDQVTALKLAERALSIAPKNTAVLFKVANFAGRTGDVRGALNAFKKCTEADPKFPDGWYQLSALLAKSGDKAGSDRVLQEGLRNCPQSPGLLLERGKRYLEAKRYQEAAADLQASIRIRPDEAQAYIELFRLLCQVDQVEEGLQVLQKALLAEPAHPTLLTTMLFYQISVGNEAEARRWYAKVRQQPRVDRPTLERLEIAFFNKFGRRVN